MTLYYFDTSALVKYYHTEAGSAWVKNTIDELTTTGERVNRSYIAELAIVESAAAFAILERTHQITIRLRDAMYRESLKDVVDVYRAIHVTRSHVGAAADLTQRHPLKSYDALQLAVALHTHQLLNARKLTLTFVSGDKQLLRAAQAEGLTMIDPMTALLATSS